MSGYAYFTWFLSWSPRGMNSWGVSWGSPRFGTGHAWAEAARGTVFAEAARGRQT